MVILPLSKIEIAKLQELQKSDEWDIVIKMLNKRVADLGSRALETEGSDGFMEMRVLHKCQGGVEELKKFFDDLERGAFE